MITKEQKIPQWLAQRIGYFPEPMNPPPAEKKPNVAQFALTAGCSHALCTFCEMYGEKKNYREKSLSEFKAHVDAVIHALTNVPFRLFCPDHNGLDRIFIGAGNALCVETDKLTEATQYALERMTELHTGNIPRRLAIYGNVNDVLKQGYHGLRQLRCGGTCGLCSIGRLGERRGIEVVYLGLESGNSEVLKIAGKGYDHNKAMIAADNLYDANIRTSVMVIPGLGGISNFNGHIADTVEVLNSLQPEWITFIGLKIGEGTPYAKWINSEELANRNRRLTPKEITEQTAQIIERLRIATTTVGIHGDDVHTFGHNPKSIGAHKIGSQAEQNAIAQLLRS